MRTATADLPSILTRDQIAQYREEGYCILQDAIPTEHLALLRGSCQSAIDRMHREMDERKTDTLGINHRNSRYFACHPSHQDERIYDFILSPAQLSLCRDLLGPEAYAFWEQYVVKAAENGMHFSWHQDSGYVGKETPHNPYLSCWCALDDMSEENGTIYVLPFSRAGTRTRVDHVQDPKINDLVGYTGPDAGVPVVCPAGSIALFSSVTFHRSGMNRTNRPRRSYLIQYSDAPIMKTDGASWGRVEHVLRHGEPVPRAEVMDQARRPAAR